MSKIKDQIIRRAGEIAYEESRATCKSYEDCIDKAIEKACSEFKITKNDYVKIFK